jgi:phasin family protein
MNDNFKGFPKFGKEQMEAASTAAASLATGFQSIAAEMTDYSQKSLETNSAYVEKLLRAKSLDDAVRTQSEYAKSAHESLVAQATKIGELYTSLAKEALKPVESLIATVQSASAPIKANAAPAE